jgi:hypothetical protein
MPTYLLACVVMGLGIGFDVVLATISRLKYIEDAKREDVQGKNAFARVFSWLKLFFRSKGMVWVRRITTTHIGFPMIGYYVFIGLFRSTPGLRKTLGVMACLLVTYFLVGQVKKWLSDKEEKIEDEWNSWAAVLPVSWDALFSGPAKSAQAINWSEFKVALSFFISGLVVTGLACGALIVALGIRKIATALLGTSLRKMTWWHLAMMYVEFTVLCYFGVLALFRYTLAPGIHLLGVALIALAIGAGVFFLFRRKLFVMTRARIKTMLMIDRIFRARSPSKRMA